MSTSDPAKITELVTHPESAGAAAAEAAGLPDASVMTQWANEFFRSASTAASGTSSVPVSPPIAGAPIAGAVPTEAQLAALPATLNAAAPGIAPPGAMPRAIPSLGFLDEIRSLSPVAISEPARLAAPADLASRQIPGVRGYSPAPPASLNFLDEASSLDRFASAATSAPISSDFPSASFAPAGVPGMPGGIPSMGFLSEIRSLLPAATSEPARAAAPADLASRQIPGVRGYSPAPPASLNFLDEANALDPLVSAPTFSPVSSDFQSGSFADLSSGPFDVSAVRRDFPILQEKINGRQLVWLDNAATTHKPQSVIDRLSYFYSHENSNIHRAAHTLAARATDAYEAAREKVRRFLNASSTNEIIFVRGATEAINLVAQSWGRRNIQKDDEIVITWLEHHANIVPWQMLCAEKGAKLRVAPVDDRGQVLLDEYEKLLNPRTRLVAFAHVSNALGTITPVEHMIDAAHRHGAKVLVDGAQAVSHLRVDVQAFDCDFYVFSGHKVFAPTGIGVVFGKAEVLDAMPPWQGGGNMITDVTFEKTQYQTPPGRFEAGTGSIGDAVGLGAAIDYLDRIGMANVSRYEHDLLVYATEAMQRIPGLRLIGTAAEKASVLSFVLDGFRTEDVGAALNQEGIAVRSGHHCAQPILRRFGLESTVRPSLALYNTCEDIDAMINAIWNLKSGRHSGVV